MSWQIGVKTNELKVSKKGFEELKEWAEGEGHYLYHNSDGTIQFDCDAMEHMDFLWDPSAQEILKRHGAEGTVMFMSSEGDNAGSIWGYSFEDGRVDALEGVVVVKKKSRNGPA